jgi:hypothetical protein
VLPYFQPLFLYFFERIVYASYKVYKPFCKASYQAAFLISRSSISTSKYKFRFNFYTNVSFQVLLSYQLYSLQVLFLSIISQIRSTRSSPIGRVYIPSSLPLQASDNSVIAFPTLLALELEFRLILESTYNCSIFTQAKKATYCCWLENPDTEVEGNTTSERNKDCNNRYTAITRFQLDQGCIYRKSELYKDMLFRLQYVALDSNTFEII